MTMKKTKEETGEQERKKERTKNTICRAPTLEDCGGGHHQLNGQLTDIG
jgi:hypothetical protein